MQLVTTKPGVIVPEHDREISGEGRELLRSRLASFDRCYVELGSGSGMHLLSLAERSPSALCIGLEIRFKRAFRTGEKAQERGLQNVLVLRTDARQIPSLFDENEVSGFLINYPDPWEKRRWRKNRLINQGLLDTMWRLLKPGGFVRYKTDHQEYFSSVVAIIQKERWSVDRLTTDLLNSEYLDGNIPTEFEMLFKSQGKPLCLLEMTKI